MPKSAVTLLSSMVLACSILLPAASGHAHTLRVADGTLSASPS
jgi:hypothetical protein